MMTALTIHVTQADIDLGQARDCYGCPIAIAVGRTVGEEASVGADMILCGTRAFTLPPKARAFIRDFDKYEAVQPFTFELVERLY